MSIEMNRRKINQLYKNKRFFEFVRNKKNANNFNKEDIINLLNGYVSNKTMMNIKTRFCGDMIKESALVIALQCCTEDELEQLIKTFTGSE